MKQLGFTPERNGSQWDVLLKIFFLSVLLVLPVLASIGKFSALSGDVSIIENGKAVKATMQSQIDKSDAIKTGKDGKAQIVFKDNTVVTLGINSDFAIEEYFQDAKAPKVQFSVGKGTFKALTGAMGKINPEGFKLKTKTATIGIRGTQFMGQTGGSEEKVGCTQGSISVTGADGQSVNVGAGQMTSFAPGQPPATPQAFTPAEQQGMEQDSGMNEMPSDTATQESAGGIEAGAAATEEGAAEEGGEEETTATEGEGDAPTEEGATEGFAAEEPAIAEPVIDTATIADAAATAQDVKNDVDNTDTDIDENNDEIDIEEAGNDVIPVTPPVVSGGDTGGDTPSEPSTETVKTLSGTAFNYLYEENADYYNGITEGVAPQIIKEGDSYYYRADYTAELTDYEGNPYPEPISLSVSLDSYDPSDTYTGWSSLHDDTGSEYASSVLLADSMMEVFYYMGHKYIESPYESAGSIIISGEKTAYSSLPSDGIYGYYSVMSMDHATSTTSESQDPGYINWRNKTFLSIWTTENGDMGISMGKIMNNNDYAEIDGITKELDMVNQNVFDASLEGSLLGSQQQGITLLERYNDGGIGVTAGFQDLASKQTSPTPSATTEMQGYTATYIYDGFNRNYYSDIGSVDSLTLYRSDGIVKAQINPSAYIFNGSGSYIQYGTDPSNSSAHYKSAYIRDDYFAALPTGGTLSSTDPVYSYSPSEGFMVAIDQSADAGSDYVSWGYWAQKVTQDEGDPEESYWLVDPKSLWIAGELTSVEALTSLKDSATEATYAGSAIGYLDTGSGLSALTSSSGFTMNVNFQTGVIMGNMNLSATDGGSWTEGLGFTASSNMATVTAGAPYEGYFDGYSGTSQIKGAFYGPNAEATGGAFDIDDSANSRKAFGIFKGTQQ